MNIHKISAATIARTACLLLALTNQGTQRLGKARAAHREPDRGAAGHRRHHHRGRAGELVEQQQFHRRCHSGRRRIRPPEAERRVNRHPNGAKVTLFKLEVLLF